MTVPTITCPRCGATSTRPKDIEQGYCGRCHEFTGDGDLPEKWQGADYLARTADREAVRATASALDELRAGLDLPPILPYDTTPVRAQDILYAGPDVSVRSGSIFYTENGEPLELEFAAAMREIEAVRTRDGGILLERMVGRLGAEIAVSTGYLGIDMSTFRLPLVWETLIVCDQGDAVWIVEPWRYTTRAAAHAGHARVTEAVRREVC